MNGAESLIRTLLNCGVDTCFANPGTSEMHFVAALDRVPGMRAVLGLFEGVATGAADGYARLADRPAATLMHCGPGLANGLANLHNARRAGVPIVNIVGDQATFHAQYDPPLAADTEAMAGTVSAWVKKVSRTEELGASAAEAVRAARTAPGAVATLILPSDVSWSDGGIPAMPLAVPAPSKSDDETVRSLAKILRSGEPAVLLLGGAGLRLPALQHAARIAAKTGVRLFSPTFAARIERGGGRPRVERLAYVIERAVQQWAGAKHLILAGARVPAAFFAYPGKPSLLHPEDAAVHALAHPEEDVTAALAALADALGCAPYAPAATAARAASATGTVNAQAVAQSLTALLPENAIIIDESISFGRTIMAETEDAPPHDWLQVTGGAIGGGLPLAVGAAVAAPDRRVFVLQADGSALYTIQSLWSLAREKLDVTAIILNNASYAILFHELTQTGANAGPAARSLFSLTDPELGWTGLANAMGVEGARAATMEQFNTLIASAASRKGPFLIELMTR